MNVTQNIKQGMWILSSLACITFFYLSALRPQHTYKLGIDTLLTSVDSTITHLSVNQFDETGQLSHHLYAPKVQHTPQNNIHRFEAPQILVKQPDQSTWEIQSNQAESIQGGKEITFLGHVKILQNEKNNTITTEELTYYPNEKLATTNSQVLFKQPGTSVESKGMRAYLDKKHIELLSQSHAIFEHHNA